jgi:hypothetical protein
MPLSLLRHSPTPTPKTMTPTPQTPPATEKPTMSRKEANWQVHVAGMQASASTEATGIDPATASHLLDAATGLTVQNIAFPPITAGFLMMLPLIEGLRDKCQSMSQEGGQLAALAFCLGEPDAAWKMLRQKDDGASFECAAFAYASQFTLSDLRTLAKWMTAQMAALNESGEDPAAGKQS